MFRNLLTGCALFAALALTACGGAISSPNASVPTKTPFPAPTPVGLETPAAGKIYLGAYVSNTKLAKNIGVLETLIGRKFALDSHYYSWVGNFPGTDEASDVVAGRLPIDTWNCQLSNAQVAAGAGDLLIATRALAIKNFGHPVFLRYMPDANDPATAFSRGICYDAATDNPDGTFSATQYVLAWQHIRAIFAQEKVTNVIWVWSMAAPGPAPAVDPTPFYPGDAFVDWVSIDGYDNVGTAGFTPTIAPLYTIAATFHKPMLITETGTVVASQPTYLQAALPALKAQFPLVDGFVYYDADGAPYGTSGPQGQLALRAAGVAAFAAMGADPYVSAFGSL